MRIVERFADADGRPEWHYPVLCADVMARWGFPKLTLLERNVWCYLYWRLGQCPHPCSINEAARKVWGGRGHKNAASRTLMGLAVKGLVLRSENGFEAVVPSPARMGGALNSAGGGALHGA